jgi:hypothetical protein
MFPKMGQESLPTEANNDTTAYYFVEMQKNFGEPKIYKGAITQPTTVQQALDESGAKKQFSSMTVDVHRKLPTGGVLKLPVGFKKGKQVKYEQDYALHPGDRIVVHPQSNSPFDKFVDSVLGKN